MTLPVVASRRFSIEWTLICSAVALAALFAGGALIVGLDALLGDLRLLGPATLGLFTLLMVWHVGCRFLRWFFLARALGLPLPPGPALLYYGAGLGMTLTPGRLGETLRLWFIQKRFGTPYRRLGALYVADRVCDATTYLVMLAAASGASGQGFAVTWGPLVAIVVVIAGICQPRLLLAVLAFSYRMRRGRQTVRWLRRLLRNTATLLRPSVFLPALLIGIAGWCAAPLVLTMALSRLGSPFDFLPAVAICAASALTGGATMAPGGLGGTELAMVALLVAAGVPLDAAIPATVATRITFLWLPITLGMLVFPLALRSMRRLEARA
ncbi:MAG: hypothetical protein JWL84_864 [Rhodospirillales bacterium]|nr:hypothetical protein [Rhodospirillales bacterium]